MVNDINWLVVLLPIVGSALFVAGGYIFGRWDAKHPVEHEPQAKAA